MKTEMTPRRSRQFSWLAIAFLGLLITQITGCETPPPTTVPEGSAAMKQQALSFTPPAGKAGIYVIRPYQFNFEEAYDYRLFDYYNANIHIGLDYQEFGSLQTNSYLFGLVPPGKHALGPSDIDLLDSRSLSVQFTAEAGKNYYFTATGRGDLIPRDLHITPISETNGQAYVRQFKLSGENRFEFQNQPGQTQ
jgi:hypothetical protein